jgi:quinolinate synthase
MGNNLEVMLKHLTTQPDSEIKKYHPAHNQKSIAKLLKNFSYFKNGNCVVHHMFGDKVVNAIRENYDDAYITAHFEVPGPMFKLAMEKIQKNSGTVGSTSDILNFIINKAKSTDESFKVVLGTESGMITKLSQMIQKTLKEHGGKNQTVEVIFPVSSDAVTVSNDKKLGIVPGVRGGEGCSTEGGCASCPYMKMNTIDGLLNVVEMLNEGKTEELKKYEVVNKISDDIVDKALKPIFAMRYFQKNKEFPEWAFQS